MLLYSSGLNKWIRHLDMSWNIFNFVVWSETLNKQSSCSGNYKSGAFVPGQSAQQFKIQSHFGIFDP